jgi:hypothetical protein
MLVRMRMCQRLMGVFVCVLCLWRDGRGMGVVVVTIIMGMLMGVGDSFVGVDMRMIGHRISSWSL